MSKTMTEHERNITILTSKAITFFVLLTIACVLFLTGYSVCLLAADMFRLNVSESLTDIIFIVILVKAYRVLIFYYQAHHVSVKYIMEIAIIAPSMEVIFAFSKHSIALNIVLGLFSLGNLILYLLFYDKINMIDLKEEDLAESHMV